MRAVIFSSQQPVDGYIQYICQCIQLNICYRTFFSFQKREGGNTYPPYASGVSNNNLSCSILQNQIGAVPLLRYRSVFFSGVIW